MSIRFKCDKRVEPYIVRKVNNAYRKYTVVITDSENDGFKLTVPQLNLKIDASLVDGKWFFSVDQDPKIVYNGELENVEGLKSIITLEHACVLKDNPEVQFKLEQKENPAFYTMSYQLREETFKQTLLLNDEGAWNFVRGNRQRQPQGNRGRGKSNRRNFQQNHQQRQRQPRMNVSYTEEGSSESES